MLKYKFNELKKENSDGSGLAYLSKAVATEARAFHSKIPSYEPTPLVSLPTMSKKLGLASLYVKDESKRFGLNAFKSLGGSFAVAKIIAAKLGRDIGTLSFDELASAETKSIVGDITFVTATDGNHGRGIAWAAEQLGFDAVIFMPKGSSKTRARNIVAHGAQCHITDLNYDDTVRYAAQFSRKIGGVFVQDTAWDGYEEIPTWIMQGYLTLIDEALDQIEKSGGPLPTHVILQAGVGSFAGAMMGYIISSLKEKSPKMLIVEPNTANCLYISAVAADGKPHAVGGSLSTIMAGLACGEPNTLSWPILRDYSDCFFSVDDNVAAIGMRLLAAPRPGSDQPIVSGESGAVGAGLIYELMANQANELVRVQLCLDPSSTVLIISTEGDTSSDVYDEIVWLGRNAYSSE